MTTNLTKQIASSKTLFGFLLYRYIYVNRTSIFELSSQFCKFQGVTLLHDDKKDVKMYVKYTVPTLNDPKMTFNLNWKIGTKTFLNH